MRSSFVCIALGISASAWVACGDDDNPVADAAVDAPVDTPTAPVFKGYDADEGGEVRMEYVRFPDGMASARVIAFFYANPGSKKFFPFPNLNGCTDMRGKTNWPMGANPIAERTYLDPGDVIISSGGGSVLKVPRNPAEVNDFLARPQAANKWFFHFSRTANDGLTFLPPKQRIDVAITGSAELPGQVFTDVAYMPADFPLTTPGIEPVALNNAGMPQTFTWGTPANDAPPGYDVTSLVAFTGPKGPVLFCVEPNDGSVVVPANMIAIARAEYPTGGTLARQTFTHVTRELVDNNGPTGRRIDFIGTWCYATQFTVTP